MSLLPARLPRQPPPSRRRLLRQPPPPTVTAPHPTAPPASAVVLPAPLYYLAEGDIWRMEQDGSTVLRITDELSNVIEFDISPLDGRLAYTLGTNDHTAQTLVLAAADGSAPTPQTRSETRLGSPRWSPNGTLLAYDTSGRSDLSDTGGTYILDTRTPGALPELLQPNAPIPDPTNPTGGESYEFYAPLAWSPAGDALLLQASFGLAVRPLTGELMNLLAPPGADMPRLPCCDATWSQDGQSVYVASDGDLVLSTITPGLWQADRISGQSATLVMRRQAGSFAPTAAPYETPGGRLLMFATVTRRVPIPGMGPPPLLMSTYDRSRDPAFTYLRTDEYVPDEILWAQDGNGAVLRVFDNTSPMRSLVWLPADGSAAVLLERDGSNLHWGMVR
ncbi:MAG: hypothetical protein HC914_08470 [Chloroflexaceae bacterium]|nr:hypothetical protein [Chloroflexaceae bacterium]